MKKTKVLRRIMIFWTLFIGIGAVAGAIMMLAAPDGMGMTELLPYFQILPFADLLFQNLIFPGIALLIVNGITNLTAAYFILKNKKVGAYLGCIFGFTLMLWIVIQFVIFPFNFISTTYFIFGVLQFLCGVACINSLKEKGREWG